MKKTLIFTLTLLIAASLSMAGASCKSPSPKTPAAQDAKPAPKDGRKSADGQQGRQGGDMGKGNMDHKRRGEGARADQKRGARKNQKQARGAMRKKTEQLCAASPEGCDTLRTIRKSFKTHCDANPDLCKTNRPQMRKYTEAAMDSCIKDKDQCAAAMKDLDTKISKLIQKQ